jgi:hypothetical protein
VETLAIFKIFMAFMSLFTNMEVEALLRGLVALESPSTQMAELTIIIFSILTGTQVLFFANPLIETLTQDLEPP